MTDPLEAVLKGLAVEKQRISMTEEMGRRVGVPKELALRILALENTRAREQQRPVDMVAVANAISIVSTQNLS